MKASGAVSLEDFPVSPAQPQPRASVVLEAGTIRGLRSTIWMGGAHSHIGSTLTEDHFRRAWVLDCAGDMPGELASVAAKWNALVFADIDERPAKLQRLQETTKEWAMALTKDIAATTPEHVFLMCQYGMNRSGLAAGLLLRSLGVDAEETVSRIRRARPGALSNQAFVQVLRDWRG